MNIAINYQNRKRSLQAETYLYERLAKIMSLSSGVNKAHVEMIREADGNNTVKLSIASPKPFEANVVAKHENLYGAMALAIEKLKRKVIKVKKRFISQKKKSPSLAVMREVSTEEQQTIDAEDVMKFEQARKKRKD